MSFRCRQRVRLASSMPVMALKEVTLESGEIVHLSEDKCQVQLPKPELFDLKNQLKAGVNLEEVSSTVLSASSVDAEAVLNKFTKKSTKKEVSHED